LELAKSDMNMAILKYCSFFDILFHFLDGRLLKKFLEFLQKKLTSRSILDIGFTQKLIDKIK